MLLGLLIRGVVLAAALSAIVVVVSGVLDKDKAKEVMYDKNIKAALVKKIDNCTNCVILEDICSDEKIEIRCDDIADDMKCGDIIYSFC